MADSGPTWIVSERQDGANVNNWHWTEKDITDDLKARFHSEMENQILCDQPEMRVETKSIASFDGEGTVYNRKGKVSFLIEAKLTVEWEGKVLDSEGEEVAGCKGKLEIPEIEQDSDMDSFTIDVRCEKEEARVIGYMRKEGRKWTRQVAEKVIKDLRETYNIGQKASASPVAGDVPVQTAKPAGKKEEKKKEDHGFEQIKLVVEWRAPIAEIFNTFTDQGRVSAYTRAPAVFEKKAGGTFSFMGGSMRGTIVEFEENQRVVMNWRNQEWPEGVESKVEIKFEKFAEGETMLSLVQTHIPEQDAPRMRAGWRDIFFRPIQHIFGFSFSWKEGEESSS